MVGVVILYTTKGVASWSGDSEQRPEGNEGAGLVEKQR